MSKNENVVDDWECIDDSELNTKVDQLKKSATNESDTSTTSTADCTQPFAAMLINDDDCLRTQYVPPEPTVKILRRPANDKNNQQAEQKPKAPIKTLQQREQEYAEARLRILGSAKSAEDEQEEAAQIVNKNGTGPGTGLGTATFNPNQTNGYSSRNMNSNNVCPPQQQALVGPIGPIGSSSRPFNRNFLPQQYQNNFQQPLTQLPHHLQQQLAFQPMAPDLRRIDSDNVVRLPRGPDGSTGFILKR